MPPKKTSNAKPRKRQALRGGAFTLDPKKAKNLRRVGLCPNYEVYFGTYEESDGVETDAMFHNMLLYSEQIKEMSDKIKEKLPTLIALSHPNLQRYIGAYKDEHSIWIVLGLTKGISLYHKLKDWTSIGGRQLMQIALQVADALSYLHTEGVIVKDFSSRTIVIPDSPEEPAKLEIDPGELLDMEQVSIDWAAPEILDGQKATPMSDVYSFGMVLWELASGKKLWEHLKPANGRQDVLQMRIYHTVAKQDGRPPLDGFNKRLADIIQKCWQKDPSERPNMEQVLVDLKALGDEIPKAGQASGGAKGKARRTIKKK